LPHARCIQPAWRFAQGYDLARKAALEFLETFKQSVDPGDREVMRCVARTSLTTKLAQVRCTVPSAQLSPAQRSMCWPNITADDTHMGAIARVPVHGGCTATYPHGMLHRRQWRTG
jgi:hypothetical protein